jgi:hypothetical protein
LRVCIKTKNTKGEKAKTYFFHIASNYLISQFKEKV